MVSLGAVLSLAALGVSAFLGLFVLGVNPRGTANRAFGVLMLAFVLWDVAEAIQRSMAGAAAEAIEPFARAAWIGISLVPAALMHLSLAYPEGSPALRRRWVLPAVYAPFVAWAVLVAATDFVIDGVSENALGASAHVSRTYPIAAVLFGAWMYAAVAGFVLTWTRVRGGARRMQGVVAAGLVIGTIPAGVTEVFWPLLSGADTRMGLGTLYTLVWSAIIAFAVARYHYLVIEPVMEVRPPPARRHGLDPGMNYLVLEPGRATAMGAFREVVARTPGLCVTGLPPSRVARRFGLERTPVVWLTTTSGEARAVRPVALDFELLHTIVKFLREHPGTAVLLDDLDYLAEVNGFGALARFLRRVTNQASASGGTTILAVGQGTFEPEHLAVLRGAVDHVLEVLQAPVPGAVANGEHVLLLVSSQQAPAALGAAGCRGGLLLTTEHPSKARQRFGPAYEVLWATDASESAGPTVRPTSLDAEARRTVGSFIASHPGSDVAVVGLEQLALFNEFPAVLAFVKDILDLASLGGCRLFATLGPDSMPPREVAILARRFDAPTPPGIREPLPSAPSTAAPGSRILYRGPVS